MNLHNVETKQQCYGLQIPEHSSRGLTALSVPRDDSLFVQNSLPYVYSYLCLSSNFDATVNSLKYIQ